MKRTISPDVMPLKATADASRATALGFWTSGDRTPEVLALEREVRDRLMATKVDALTVTAKYLGAIQHGDMVFVSAVENPPTSSPVFTPDARAKGSALKVERSPLWAQLGRRKPSTSSGSVVAIVRTELGKLAQEHGVWLDG